MKKQKIVKKKKPILTNELNIDSLIKERNKLSKSLEKLEDFLIDRGCHISFLERKLLNLQLDSMQEYHSILSARVSLYINFNKIRLKNE